MNSSQLYNSTIEKSSVQTFYGLERKKVNQPNKEELIVNAPSKPDIAKTEKSTTDKRFRISGDAQYIQEQRYVSKNEGRIYGLRVPSIVQKSENIHMLGHNAEIGNAGLSQFPFWFANGMYNHKEQGEKIENQL